MNGRIDEAQIEAILAGGQATVNRYVVTALQQLTTAVEGTPRDIDDAIRRHRAECRDQSRKTLYGLLAALGTCIGLATPYILRLVGG